MAFRGIASKKTAALGGAAVVAGATLSALAIAAAPSARADVQGVSYSCTLSLDGTPPETFGATADFSGTAPPSAQTGDSVQLQDVSVTLHVSSLPTVLSTLLAQSIDGTFSPIEIDAATGDADQQTARPEGTIDHVAGPILTSFDLTASPGTVSGFTANKAGTMTFGAGSNLDATLEVKPLVGDSRQLVLACSRNGAAATIAATNVTAKPTPPTQPSQPSQPPSHSSSHPSAPEPSGQNSAPPVGLSDGTPTAVTSSSSTSRSATGRSTAAHPQLANTGFSAAAPLGIGGGALILVGGGLLYLARRREATDAGTVDA